MKNVKYKIFILCKLYIFIFQNKNLVFIMYNNPPFVSITIFNINVI